MNRWFNPSHPQTLQAAIILGYISAVFGLLGGASILLILFIGVGVGAFGSANNKRWGYLLLAATATLVAAVWWYFLVLAMLSGSLEFTLRLLNNAVFPTALVVAVLHAHSREYQRIWFE